MTKNAKLASVIAGFVLIAAAGVGYAVESRGSSTQSSTPSVTDTCVTLETSGKTLCIADAGVQSFAETLTTCATKATAQACVSAAGQQIEQVCAEQTPAPTTAACQRDARKVVAVAISSLTRKPVSTYLQ